jgi:hypothetical protein
VSLAAVAWRRLRAAVGADPADRLWREGRFEEARAASDPGDGAARRRLAHLALLGNDLPEAIARLESFLRARPRDATALGLLAEALYRRNDALRAAPLLRRIGRKAFARALESFGAREPYRMTEAGSATLPFVRTDPLPVVVLDVNGHAGRFLIDTGGAELILGEEMAGKVGAARFGTEAGYFGGRRSASYEHGTVERVGLGGLAVHDVPVQVMKHVREMGAAIGEPGLDGILGTVLLSRFRPTIDYAAGHLRLDPRGHAAARPSALEGGVAVPFWLAGHHMVLARGRLAATPPMLLFVDTGLGGVAFTAPASTLTAAGVSLDHAQTAFGTGGGGRLAVVPFRVSELALGDHTRTDLDGLAGAFPPPLEWDMGFRIGGLISHQYFRAGALTLDFDAMRLTVR